MGKEKDRKPRNKASKKLNIAKPITPFDIDKIGSDDDPCFGKLYDLTEEACKRCGDNTICAIAFNQKTIKMRNDEESNNRFKDVELEVKKTKETKESKYVKSQLSKGITSFKIIKKLISKFNLTKEEARKLVKSKK